jgi:hypothetical protein
MDASRAPLFRAQARLLVRLLLALRRELPVDVRCGELVDAVVDVHRCRSARGVRLRSRERGRAKHAELPAERAPTALPDRDMTFRAWKVSEGGARGHACTRSRCISCIETLASRAR